jgi:TnpA family transposase
MLTTTALIEEIDKFVKDAGISDAQFGRQLCNDHKFLPRLREAHRKGTGGVKLERAQQILAFIKARRRGKEWVRAPSLKEWLAAE